ncbi:LytTR family DNA-binding domain-containing protein [uncultured Lacinutrix sp.]|uniref:LytR/AlgR family response regulator transcription factor n=1 Tax=uncultured Lacinutrix sp. TaxID=574032 RepID=UPI0026136319|nr:LytTR family DNA-binding domain-containing protein [uncultured Lacinutrix sp.]
MRLSILIVDDEPHARRHIKSLISQDSDVEVIYECKNGKQVLEFLKHQTPSVIFLDINMPGISGVEVAAQLKTTNSLIIFSTAYDEYALKAFELEAFDYLLKPYEDDRFFEVLQRAKNEVEIRQQAEFSQKFTSLYQEYNNNLSPHLTEFSLKEKGFEYKIHVEEVLYIEASTIYAELHLKEKKLLYRAALNLLEQQLPNNFIRVHRSFIINTSFIKDYKYLNNNTFMITMANTDVIISSRKYKEIISKRLN